MNDIVGDWKFEEEESRAGGWVMKAEARIVLVTENHHLNTPAPDEEVWVKNLVKN